MADAPSSSSETSHKKRRINTVSKVKSCAECRRLKLRCDREEPCNNCVRRGTGAICPTGALKPAKGRTLILDSSEALHDRIASLEQALQQYSAAQGEHPLLRNAYHLEATLETDDGVDAGGTVFSHQSATITHGSDASAAHDGPWPVDGVALRQSDAQAGLPRPGNDTGTHEHVDEQSGHLQVDQGDLRTSRFYGDASSLFLADHSSAVDGSERVCSTGPYRFRKGWIEGFIFESDSALRPYHTLNELVAQLPARDEALHLIRTYFDSVAWGSNIVLESSFEPEFFGRFYGEKKELDAQRLAVLCFTLALGALFDPAYPAGADNNPQSCDLFALGRASLSLDSYGSIIFVQAIHLMVTWLNNGGRPVPSNQSTWPLVGLAMRVVQALGLHRDGRHFNLPVAVAEERRRIFWEMYSYDIAHSVASARPRSMTTGTYDVDFPVTPPGGQHYHEYRYRLCQLECKINDEQSNVQPTPYDKVIELDREFRTFQQDLPSELMVNETTQAPQSAVEMIERTQRLTMRFRCNVCFLVLHRGWFAKALEECPQEPIRSQFSTSYVGCLEACKLILSVLRQLADDAPLIFQRRWFLLFHAFTACVCLAASVIRAPRSVLAQSSLLALDEGLRLFEKAGKPSEHAILCPLRDTARRSLLPSGREEPPSDEDLALLGKRRTRTGSVTTSPHTFSQSPMSPTATMQHGTPRANSAATLLALANILSSEAQGHQAMSQPTSTRYEAAPGIPSSTLSNTMQELDMSVFGDVGGAFDQSIGSSSLGPSEFNEWSTNTNPFAGFDIEAFMSTFGLNANDPPLGSLGGTPNWHFPGE